MPEMVALAVTKGVDSSICDMCAYGMVAEEEPGLAPVEKGTMMLSNLPKVMK